MEYIVAVDCVLLPVEDFASIALPLGIVEVGICIILIVTVEVILAEGVLVDVVADVCGILCSSSSSIILKLLTCNDLPLVVGIVGTSLVGVNLIAFAISHAEVLAFLRFKSALDDAIVAVADSFECPSPAFVGCEVAAITAINIAIVTETVVCSTTSVGQVGLDREAVLAAAVSKQNHWPCADVVVERSVSTPVVAASEELSGTYVVEPALQAIGRFSRIEAIVVARRESLAELPTDEVKSTTCILQTYCCILCIIENFRVDAIHALCLCNCNCEASAGLIVLESCAGRAVGHTVAIDTAICIATAPVLVNVVSEDVDRTVSLDESALLCAELNDFILVPAIHAGLVAST